MDTKYMLTASRLTPMLELLYIIFIDKIQGKGGKPDESTSAELQTVAREVLPVWGVSVPELRQIVLSVLRGTNKEQAYAQLGQTIKVLYPQGKEDREVPSSDLDIFATLGAYFRTDSTTALNKCIKFASLSKSPWVVQRLSPKVGNQQDTKTALSALVKSLVGRSDTILTNDEALNIKEVKPDAYKAYLALRKEFNQAWRDALVSFVRKSGKDKVPYEDALEYLKLNGIDHLMTLGFDGLIDDLSKLYTNEGEAIEGAPAATLFPSVKMNPTYGEADGGDWVFMALRANGEPGPYFYTSKFKKSQSDIKFKKVKELATKMPQIRKRWFALVKAFDITKPDCVAAVVLEILFECSARIGSVGNMTAGEPTFGVATLLMNHVIQSPNGGITLRYSGKHGVAAKNKILPSDPYGKYVIEAIKQMVVGKKPRDRLFTYNKGDKSIAISPALVNKLFHTCGAPQGTNVHKIRTYTGSALFETLMEEQFAKPTQPKTEKEALLLFQKMAEIVGKKLNHMKTNAKGEEVVTGTTALTNYIDTETQISYWRTLGFRLPKYLEALEKDGDNQ